MEYKIKKSKTDLIKIRARFHKKIDDYTLMSLEDLKHIFINQKLSKTDLEALLLVTNTKLKNKENGESTDNIQNKES